MKKPLLRRIRHWIIQRVFNRYYGNFFYPFELAEQEWASKPESQRWRMYRDISEFVKSDVYRIEYQNIVRKFYNELALESKTEEQIAGYRLALLFLKSFDVRLKKLAEEGLALSIFEDTSKKLT